MIILDPFLVSGPGYQILRLPDNLITRYSVKPSLFEPVYQNETLTIMNPDTLLIDHESPLVLRKLNRETY